MNKLFDPATTFKFTPADFVPFKDREICEKLFDLIEEELRSL